MKGNSLLYIFVTRFMGVRSGIEGGGRGDSRVRSGIEVGVAFALEFRKPCIFLLFTLILYWFLSVNRFLNCCAQGPMQVGER